MDMFYSNSRHARRCSREAKPLFAADVTQTGARAEREVGLRRASVAWLPAARRSEDIAGDSDYEMAEEGRAFRRMLSDCFFHQLY